MTAAAPLIPGGGSAGLPGFGPRLEEVSRQFEHAPNVFVPGSRVIRPGSSKGSKSSKEPPPVPAPPQQIRTEDGRFVGPPASEPTSFFAGFPAPEPATFFAGAPPLEPTFYSGPSAPEATTFFSAPSFSPSVGAPAERHPPTPTTGYGEGGTSAVDAEKWRRKPVAAWGSYTDSVPSQPAEVRSPQASESSVPNGDQSELQRLRDELQAERLQVKKLMTREQETQAALAKEKYNNEELKRARQQSQGETDKIKRMLIIAQQSADRGVEDRRVRQRLEKENAELHGRLQVTQRQLQNERRLRAASVRPPPPAAPTIAELARLVAKQEHRALQFDRGGDARVAEKKLLAKWHPDKQATSANADFATKVFQELQAIAN
mmetsp:Transcript_131147/g.298577  ORF Transcript_131147/g.298577 Transcript_131147/m.298577 type:complete len:375 (+) Transcript_131147:20-1144(+)